VPPFDGGMPVKDEREKQTVRMALAIAIAAGSCALGASRARAQMCTLDAGCADASLLDASRMGTDATVGAGDAGTSDGGLSIPDAGMGVDAGTDGGAGLDASTEPATTKACSCDVAENSDGLIHVCTGSFKESVCKQLSCEESYVQPKRCPEEGIRLCCEMEARGLYSQLYDDCTHPNCESGFRAECEDLGGRIALGACDAPEEPDDPDTETSADSGSCAVGHARSNKLGAPGFSLLGLTLLGLTSVRRRRPARKQ